MVKQQHKQASPRRKKTKYNDLPDSSLPTVDRREAVSATAQAQSPSRKKRYNFSRRKAKFARERDRSSSPSEDHTPTVVRRPYVPSSPLVVERRSLRRSKERPTCLIFGQHREVIYPDHFFCSNCKNYEDCINSGTMHGNANRNSRRFRCTASHKDYFLPSCLKKVRNHGVAVSQPPPAVIESVELSEASATSGDESFNDNMLLEDFRTLQLAFDGAQQMLREQADCQLQEQQAFVDAFKSEFQNQMQFQLVELSSYINNLKEIIARLRGKVNTLTTSLNKYRKKAQHQPKVQSVPLNAAIVNAINHLVSSQQRYKLLSKRNLATNIAKAVFDPNLCNGVALEEVIAESKKWLRQNVFKPSEILKQMDLRGGTLNYEGISVLNDVEASAYTGSKSRLRGRLLCTPACLKLVAKQLEREGDSICPYQRIRTPYGEGIEFDYAKVTRLVINSYGLEDAGRQRRINISASIDAARITKNLCHTSAGLKMSDIEGRDPLKNMRSFLTDNNSLRDLQSHNNVFLMKIILTKETKESFRHFDDIFQFFRLSELTQEEKRHHENNAEKFKWEHLSDLQPLAITFTTDMAADWKLVGAGGGVKNTEMFCTLCACTSTDVHQPNDTTCTRFCAFREEPNWCCYHHPIASPEIKEGLEEQVQALRQLIHADLQEIERKSLIKYYVNTPEHVMKRLPKCIKFEPSNQDEKDEFIELLMDELILRGLSPVGELEDLRARLQTELTTEHKLRQYLKKLEHCTTLEQALIVLLHKIPCILHCENRVGLKLLSMLLQEGFANVKKGYLFGHIRSEKERISAYAQRIENILNTVILGDEDGPAQWALPYDAENKTVGIICLDNNRIRKILMEYELIVQASVTDPERSFKYGTSVAHYRNAISILRE
jgi:hypothetical protein